MDSLETSYIEFGIERRTLHRLFTVVSVVRSESYERHGTVASVPRVQCNAKGSIVPGVASAVRFPLLLRVAVDAWRMNQRLITASNRNRI